MNRSAARSDHPLLGQRVNVQADRGRALVGDREVGRSRAQVLEDLARGPVEQMQGDARVPGEEPGGDRREQDSGDRRQGGDRDVPVLSRAVGGEPVELHPAGLQDDLRHGQELTPGGGHLHAAGGPFEQPGADLALDVPDGPAHDRLTESEVGRSPGERPAQRDPLEHLELMQRQIHAFRA
jgi:hypothetical protein